MSDTVYAIASGKGGVGKTTTAINLGAMLADEGHAVVVVDTDLGMANLAGFLDFDIETPTLHEVLAGEATADEAIYEAPGDIDVLPSATDIEAFAKSNPANLRGVVATLREAYDYVLLDTGAGVSYDTLVPLALADGALLVATPDVASVRDTAKTGELAERVGTEVVGAVLAQRSSDILNADDVESTLGAEVLAVVPSDEAVPMGIDAGRPLAVFAPNAPAGQAYRDLAAVLIGDADPVPELELGEGDGESDDEGGDERVTPESLTDGLDADPEASPAGAEVAANVRDAIDSEDGPEGLLGGELAKAADEIRREASGGGADRESEADAGGGEPRSVDDLIQEHINDDRLGEGSDPFDASDGEREAEAEADDPFEEAETETGDDPLAETEAVTTDPFGGDGGESEGEDAAGDDDPLADAEADSAGEIEGTAAAETPAGGEADDPLGEGGAATEPAEVDDPLAESDARGAESAGAVDADSDGEWSPDAAGPEESAIPFEQNQPDPGAPEGRPDAADVGDTLAEDPEELEEDEDEDGDGVLGRLGSLFR